MPSCVYFCVLFIEPLTDIVERCICHLFHIAKYLIVSVPAVKTIFADCSTLMLRFFPVQKHVIFSVKERSTILLLLFLSCRNASFSGFSSVSVGNRNEPQEALNRGESGKFRVRTAYTKCCISG